MDHFLIVRINIGAYGRFADCSDRADRLTQTYIDIFNRWGRLSIENQTCSDFVPVLLFDHRTPKRFLDFPGWEIILDKTDKQSKERMVADREWFQQLRKMVKTDKVTTTRMDSDDFLFPEYIERQKRHLQVGRVVDYHNFLVYNYVTGHVFRAKDIKKPAQTISLTEDTETMRSVYFCPHNKIHRARNYNLEWFLVGGASMWVRGVWARNQFKADGYKDIVDFGNIKMNDWNEHSALEKCRG